MKTKQFKDENLAHFSYAICSNDEIALIDPSRNPQQYYDYAREQGATITAIIETHPHADFVSSHKEIHDKTGATIYVSELLGAEYEHQTFDDGDVIKVGEIHLKAINTPGHSPDSISILAIDELEQARAVYTGDTLFIGDCGRPDLREEAGAITASREELAKQMYHSLRNKLMVLPDEVLVYPAHGSGSLCGKGLSNKSVSTMGEEKQTNWSLQEMEEEQFINELLADQPFIPKYFTYNVSINKRGAVNYSESVASVELREAITCESCANALNPEVVIIDTRPKAVFNAGHLPNAINLMEGAKFETWLGSIIKPTEKYYLVAENETKLRSLIERAAKIGYESLIEQAFVADYKVNENADFDALKLYTNLDDYTLVDIRNETEAKDLMIFENAINIPLHELSERSTEIPTDKPIVVHCAGGYRSPAGRSIIKNNLEGVEVYDLGENINAFINEGACKI